LLTILTEQAVEAPDPGVNLFADEIDYHDQACAYDALACDNALDHHEEAPAAAPQAAPAPPCGARDADEDLAEAPAALPTSGVDQSVPNFEALDRQRLPSIDVEPNAVREREKLSGKL
jgi:hypothetical protein